MAEQEQITAEQAEALFAESFNKVTGKEYTPTQVVDTPALEVKPEPVTPVEEGKTPEAPEKKEPEPEKKEPAAEPEKKEEKKEEAKEADTDPYKWVSELPENIRGKVVAEINARMAGEHYKKSNEGRIAAYQKQILDLQREMSKVTPADKQPAPAERSPKTPEEWTKLAKDDPEIATAVEARVKSEVDAAVAAMQAEIQGLRKSDDALYEDRNRQYVEQERAALQAMVPNYVEVMTSKEFQHWRDNEAGPALRQVALTSTHHLDAVRVLQAYADDMIRSGRATPRQEQQAPAASTMKQPEQTEAEKTAKAEADRIAAERDARSRQSTVVAATTPPLGGPGNNKAQFTLEDAEAEFQRAWARLNPKKT